MSDHGRALVLDGAKATPVLAVSAGHWLMHVDWQPIVLMLTALYTAFLVIEHIYKFGRWLLGRRGRA